MLRFRDGVFFKLDVATTNADGTSSLLTPHELKLQLEWIVQSAAGARFFHVCADAPIRCLSFAEVDEEQKQTTRKLCSLTAQERSTWAKVCSSLRCCSCSLRCMLCTCTCAPCVLQQRELFSVNNSAALATIDKALFFLTLDSEEIKVFSREISVVLVADVTVVTAEQGRLPAPTAERRQHLVRQVLQLGRVPERVGRHERGALWDRCDGELMLMLNSCSSQDR